ncbi:hypothetical protein Pmani_014565 [Petrolisthes manimaculis]|uniref:Uncharacterized protein n=1 Tax=Petrolisthes manimaculis TaxID=1843537 RepID=A0AAE1PSR5_9EUCA|nr:hypothetical protein Pmani_014565 [Petrolisthes manimaculis]
MRSFPPSEHHAAQGIGRWVPAYWNSCELAIYKTDSSSHTGTEINPQPSTSSAQASPAFVPTLSEENEVIYKESEKDKTEWDEEKEAAAAAVMSQGLNARPQTREKI